MQILSLDHFVLTVNNLEESLNFYHEVLGLSIISEQTNKDFASLKCGHSLLRLRKSSNDVNAIVANQLNTGCFDFCLESAQSIDSIVTDLRDKQITPELGPVIKHGARGTMQSVYLRDPDGNLVEISSYQN